MVDFMASFFRIGHHDYELSKNGTGILSLALLLCLATGFLLQISVHHPEKSSFLYHTSDLNSEEKESAECRMNDQIIKDWLAECTALSPVELNSFGSTLVHNNELIKALYKIFDDPFNSQHLIDGICKRLFNFYRSKIQNLKLFTLQFLPNLIYIYLNSVAQGDKKSYRSIETLLIGIFNLEVVDDAGQPTVISFRLPSLAQASIYHEPMSLAHASLTETALRRLEECNTKLISWGPHAQVEALNAQNRLKTITGLLFIYNRHIGSLDKISLKYLCGISSMLASQGFKTVKEEGNSSRPNVGESSSAKSPTRIPVSSQFFLELLCGLYYAMYNGFGWLAMEAVDHIYNRSCFECYPNVILVANAIKNSSKITAKDQGNERPMGISVALTPATTTVTTVNKFMITNASFRTKKLPDDIPIVSGDEASAGSENAKPLPSITEEKEETGFSLRGSSLRGKEAMAKNLQKLGIGKKLKDKEGKSSSKTNLAGSSGPDKKQSNALQISGFKEKVSFKSPVMQNGDFSQGESDGQTNFTSTKKKPLENGPISEVSSNGSVPEGAKSSSGFANDTQSGMTTDGLDSPSSNDDVIGLFSSNNNTGEKSYMQVSSV